MIGRGDSESVAMTHEDFGPEAIGQTGEDSIVGVLYAGKTKKGFGEWADERSSMRVDCLCEQEWCVVWGVLELSCASSLPALACRAVYCIAMCGYRSQGVIENVSCDFIYSAFTVLSTSPSISHIPSYFVPYSYFSSSSLFIVLPLQSFSLFYFFHFFLPLLRMTLHYSTKQPHEAQPGLLHHAE